MENSEKNFDAVSALETARLQLRFAAIKYAGAVARLMTPPVSYWLADWKTPYTEVAAAARIAKFRTLAALGDALPYVIIDTKTNRLIGWVALTRDHENLHTASLGYWLGEPYQGKAFMREALQAVMAVGIKLLALEVIEAAAQVENVASFAVMRSVGMKHAEDKLVYAPARNRHELCSVYRIKATDVQKASGIRP